MTTVEMLLVEKKRGGFGIGNQESLLKDSRSFMMKKLLKNDGSCSYANLQQVYNL